MTRDRSLDLLRGIVMVLMVIDHTQDYQAGPGLVSDPMNLATTPGLVYFWRILSHFCAPVFALLMGISAGLSAAGRTPGAAASHLLQRGLVLIALEFTVVNWIWTFNPLWPRYFSQVIAALGTAMLCLAAAVQWPRAAVAAAGLGLVGLHNLFDGVRFAPDTIAHYVWSFLHQKNVLPLLWGFEVRTTYPVVPVCGVALCGFALAPWWRGSAAERRQRLLWTGGGLIVLFAALRLTNFYGDPSLYVGGLQSFFNVTKYPLSLQFICMTLGPALLFLALAPGRTQPALEQLGRTAMFFYLTHLALLHAGALLYGWLSGGTIDLAHRFGGVPASVGFPVWATAPIALIVTAALYPLCRWYEPRRLRFL